jgi:hypothetical protein
MSAVPISTVRHAQVTGRRLLSPAAGCAFAAAPGLVRRFMIGGLELSRHSQQWHFWRLMLSFGASGVHGAVLALQIPALIERTASSSPIAAAWVALAGVANVASGFAISWSMKRDRPALSLATLFLVRALLLVPLAPALVLGLALAIGVCQMALLPSESLLARRQGLERLGAMFGVAALAHQAAAFAALRMADRWAEVCAGGQLLLLVDLVAALSAVALAAVFFLADRRVACGDATGLYPLCIREEIAVPALPLQP